VETIAQERGLDPSNIEVWFADEARVGQKNKITRRWARRGSRPSAPSDQRTASTYIFGAICPKQGKAVGLILPWCNTYDEPASRGDLRRRGPRMSCTAAGRSGRMAPLAQARRAAQHHHRSVATEMPRVEPTGKRLAVVRDNWLSNRVFDDIHALIDHCCDAWNKLEAQPWTIMSLGMRDWAYRF
jgi:hypothetical protein